MEATTMSKGIAGVLLFALAAVGMTTGCGGGDKKEGDGAAAAGDSVGVAECDEYLTKMEACLGKMPAEAKAAQEQAFKQSREAWKQAAATPQGKEGLKTTCKASLDALAQNPMCK
jgi:hypothetical protein